MIERLSFLFSRHLEGRLTRSERIEFWGLVLEPSLKEKVRELADLAWDSAGEANDITKEKRQEMLTQLFDNGEVGKAPVIEFNNHKLRQVRPRVGWKRWSIAVSIVVALGVGGYLLLFNNRINKPNAPITAKVTDVKAPQKSKAVITLADGRTITLDSLSSISQGKVQLTKTADGRIVYSGSSNEVAFNTLTNPRGSTLIDLTLADGTKVWLNAGSSITYPVTFTDQERKVSISGEAYFEVSHDDTKAFYVSRGDVIVRVLGTHFNVNAYDDETDILVTLLEGSVKVSNERNALTIKSNQQAVVSEGQAVRLNDRVSVEEVMAWKHGKFDYRNADLETIMRQMSRWYDVEVIFADRVTDRYTVDMPRDVPLSQLFKFIEMSGGVHFTIEDRKITVTK